jgi:NAD(P)-dependent dehydrogenase (short-subunit alcohol dehydrogenase family)
MIDWERKPGFDLTGKRALIVGAGNPASRAIALGFAEAGADVAIASATPDGDEVMEAKRVAKAVAAAGRQSLAHGWDVSLPKNVQVSLRQVVKDFGAPSILVYNADVAAMARIEKAADSEYARQQDINAGGAFLCARGFLRELPEGSAGRIILLSSVLAERGMPGLAAYTATRASLAGLVAALSQESAPRGVTANCISLGWMDWTPGRGPADIGQNRLLRYIPMKRFGTADDVAGLALLLASDAAGFMNGQVYHVDGGVSAHL